VKNWKQSDWQRSGATFDTICKELVDVLRQDLPPDSPQAQALIGRHYEWLKQFWTPTSESYVGHSQLIVDSELRKAYEAYNPQLPQFVAGAIKRFAQTKLS